MKKMTLAIFVGVAIFTFLSCGQTKDLEDKQAHIMNNTEEISDGQVSKEDVLENLMGEYDYQSDYGTGKLLIKKTTYGYDIFDYESDSDYRFLADSSDIETIGNNRLYIKYPEEVFSDDTAIFSYYILEYGTDEIDVYYKKTIHDEEQHLYHAIKKDNLN